MEAFTAGQIPKTRPKIDDPKKAKSMVGKESINGNPAISEIINETIRPKIIPINPPMLVITIASIRN